jgi:hypothetical protein
MKMYKDSKMDINSNKPKQLIQLLQLKIKIIMTKLFSILMKLILITIMDLKDSEDLINLKNIMMLSTKKKWLHLMKLVQKINYKIKNFLIK